MKMLKIKASSMPDALAEAKRRLGDEAKVLHTRQYNVPGIPGLLGRREVEILAAADQPLCAVATADIGNRGVAHLERQISALRNEICELLSGTAIARRRELPPAVVRLVKNGVPESIAEGVLSGIDGDRHDRVLDAVARRIQCRGSLDCGSRQVRLALVGPTGVGKTTTAAKLAARYSLNKKKSVALLTLDTYRIGAVEQLSTYARILNVPIEVAFSPEDGEALVAKHADKDLIIIDTVGRSQRNQEHIKELDAFLKAARPTDVHLVVSASAGRQSRKEAVDVFSGLGGSSIVLTKLDECAEPGCVLDLSVSSLLPYSYVTYGQDVPDDIAVADPQSLAGYVWEGVL